MSVVAGGERVALCRGCGERVRCACEWAGWDLRERCAECWGGGEH